MKKYILLLLLSGIATAQQKFTVYFDFDIAETTTASSGKLADWIALNPDAQIQKIYGYTDKTGDAVYNQDLSERRALYVFEQLKKANMHLTEVEEKGFGESESVSSYNAKDRKAEIYYIIPKKEIQPPMPKPEQEVVKNELIKEIEKAKKGDKIRLKGMNFYNNMDTMLPSSRPVLQELLTILQERASLKIEIQGHVCCESENANKISEKRAIAVYNYLIRNGINKERLSYKSFGNTKPIYKIPEKNEEEKVANRRVEIEIVEN